MSALYASLRQARSELEIDAGDTSGDSVLVDMLNFVSARIDAITGRSFAPQRRARRFHALGSHIDEAYNALYLGSLPILEITSLLVGGVELNPYDDEENTGDYFFLEDASPYFNIALSAGAQARWSDRLLGNWRNSIRLTGIWGYRSGYPTEGWQTNMLDSVGAIDAVETLIDVQPSDSFSPGQRIRMGDEFMDITAVEDTLLTVTRGAGGTTAASHTTDTAIDTWIPELPITRAALRWAAFLYKRRGHFSSLDIDAVVGTVISRYPPDAPEEIQNILDRYTDWTPRTPE